MSSCSLVGTLGEPLVRSRGGGRGDGIGDALGSLDLPPIYTAAFAITIVIAVVTLYQMIRAALRFKAPVLPPDAPTLPYQVGKLFVPFLFLYTLVFLIYNIFYVVFVALTFSLSNSGLPSPGLASGVSFVGQLAEVFLLAMFLFIIAHRERIQLNPAEKPFNIKSFLDSWLLSVVLILGIASDAIAGVPTAGMAHQEANHNMNIAYQAFLFVASLDMIVPSIVTYSRFRKSDIQDKIIRDTVFFVSPFILIGAIFRIIDVGLVYGNQDIFFDYDVLNLAAVIILGIISIIVIEIALRIGVPPKPPRKAPKGGFFNVHKS